MRRIPAGGRPFRAEVHLFREGGRDVALNVRRSRILGLTPLEAGLLRAAGGPATEPEPLPEHAGEGSSAALAAEGRLRQEGLLLEEPPPHPSPFEIPPLVLTHLFVNVEQACNLRCPYCFAQQGDFGVKPQAMSAPTVRRAVDFLLDHSEGEPRCALTFIGGEPLLNWDVVREAVLHAEREAGRRGKGIAFSVITNGTLLTPEVVSFLRKHRMEVQVSLDGPAALQDRQRPGTGGKGTHGAIVARLPALLSELGDGVRVRATVTRVTGSLLEVVRYLEGLGFGRVSFGPVRTSHPEYALDDAAMQRFLEDSAGLAREFLARAIAGGRPHFGDFNRTLLFFCSGACRQFHCSALATSLGVSASGGLYPCNALGEVDSAFLGDVWGGLDERKLDAWRAHLDVDGKADCRDCWARYICGGGCLAMACALAGDPCRTDALACAATRRLTELAIWLHVELRERAPNFFAGLVADAEDWAGR